MKRPLLLRGARQLITLRGAEGPRRGADCSDLGIINDGSLLIRDGRILSVGQSRRIDNLNEARLADVYEAHGAVVMPGFVDCHTAIPESNAVLRRLLDLALAHGTTTLGGYGSYSALRTLEIENRRQLPFVASLQVEDDFDEGQLDRAARRNLASFLRLDLLEHSRPALRFFRSIGPAIRVHAPRQENPDWVGLALAYGAAVLELSAPLNREQTALLSDSSACAVMTANAPGMLRELLDRGAALALGSGFGVELTGTCSMLAAAALASRDGALDLAEAITMGTINAAHALGVGDICGSLESGKQANLLVLHLSDYRELSQYAGVNVVSKIFQAGTLVK